MDEGFIIKDSGERKTFESGMMRDTAAGKVQYQRIFEGPMVERWAAHLTKGAVKYPDIKPGTANWTLAAGEAELFRFKESALRHFLQWQRGDRDEDHAAAVFFNINGAEYVRGKLNADPLTLPCALAKREGCSYDASCSDCRAANNV